jgi:hypothetical protein
MVTVGWFDNLSGGIRIPSLLTGLEKGAVAGKEVLLRWKFPETVRLCRFRGKC